MLLSELNFDINTINECMSELSSVNKQDFFQSLVNSRLNKCHDKYLDEFDEELDKVYDMVNSDDCDIFKLLRLINNMSKLTNSLYKTELAIYDIL